MNIDDISIIKSEEDCRSAINTVGTAYAYGNAILELVKAWMKANGRDSVTADNGSVSVQERRPTVYKIQGWTHEETIEAAREVLGEKADDYLMRSLDRDLLVRDLTGSDADIARLKEIGYHFRKGGSAYVFREV